MNEQLKEALSKGAIYGLGGSLNGLVALLLVPFFVRCISPAEYGVVAVAEMLLAILLICCGLGINVALLSRYSLVKQSERRQLLRSLLSVILLIAPIISFGFVACAWSFQEQIIPGVTSEMLIIVGVLAILETIWLLFATQFRAEGWAERFVGLSLINSLVGLLATVILIVHFNLKGEGILYGRLVGDVVTLAVLSRAIIKDLPIRNLSPGIEVARIGLPLVPAAIASLWITMWPRYALATMGTPDEVGVFVMSMKVAGLVQLLLVQPTALTWHVMIFRIAKQAEAPKIFAGFVTFYIALSLSLVCMLSLLSPTIANYLGTREFPLSSTVIVISSFGFAFLGLSYILNIGPYLLEKTRSVLVPYAIAAGVSTASGMLLIPWLGVTGAALVFLVACATLTLLLFRASQAMYPVPIDGRAIAILVLVAGAGIGLGFSVNSASTSGTPWIGLLLLFFLLYLGCRVAFTPAQVSGLKKIGKQVFAR